MAGWSALATVSAGGSEVNLRVSDHALTKHYGPTPENSGT